MRFLKAFILICALSGTVIADGLIRDGLGARVAGRGGTNIAWSDSGTILHDNVGGMVNFEGSTLIESGIDLIFTDLEYSDPGGTGEFKQGVVPLGDFTYLKKMNDDVAVGLGVFSTGGFATRTEMPGPPSFPGERTYKSFGAFARILPGVSLRMTDRWSVGATLGVGVSHVELEGPYTLQTGFLRGTPTLMDMQATGAGLTWTVGTQYKLTPRTTVGLTYQSETRFHLDGTTTTEVPGLGVSSFDTQLDMVWPRTVGAGLRHQLTCCDVAAIDLTYYNWQKAFDDAGMFMTNATNPAFAAFGPLEKQLPLRWRDTLSVRLGYEHTLQNCNKLRGGYVYHRNPIPSQTLTPYIVPIVEHTVSVGYGTTMQGWEVDLGYQYMFGDSESVGTSDIVGGDFDNSTTKTSVHLLFVSFMRRE